MRILFIKILILLSVVGCGTAPTTPTVSPTLAAPAATAVPVAPALVAATATTVAAVAPLPTVTTAVKPTSVPPTVAPTATIITAPTTAPTAANTATPAAKPNTTASDFSPKVRSIWNTVNGSNTTSGTCAGGAILPVYGLVEITPQGNDTLIWKSQEPQPYTFKKLGPNQYQFKGPSGLGLGEQTMTVTFSNEKALRMVHQLVPAKDPACTHTFNYTGEYRWDRP